MTLRGVFYRLVGRQLLKLRRTGRVSYADITDGTRWINRPSTWGILDQMLEDAASSYRRTLWHNQAAEVPAAAAGPRTARATAAAVSPTRWRPTARATTPTNRPSKLALPGSQGVFSYHADGSGLRS